MSNKLVNAAALIAATAIVGTSGYVLFTQSETLLQASRAEPPRYVATPPAPPSDRTVSSYQAPAERSPIGDNLQREAAQRLTSGVYRCEENGTIIYADQPCMNGRPVDVRASAGKPAEAATRRAARPASPIANEARAAEVRPIAGSAEVNGSRNKRCASIEVDIEQIDSLARRGGTAAFQDQLRERRRELLGEKARLSC